MNNTPLPELTVIVNINGSETFTLKLSADFGVTTESLESHYAIEMINAFIRIYAGRHLDDNYLISKKSIRSLIEKGRIFDYVSDTCMIDIYYN